MGYRLTYCSEYKVKHSDNQIGNYQTEALNNVLYALVRGDMWWNTDELDFADVLEIDKELINDMIERLDYDDWEDVPFPEGGFHEGIYAKELQDFGLTPKELKEFLEDALEHGEESIDCIRFEWL